MQEETPPRSRQAQKARSGYREEMKTGAMIFVRRSTDHTNGPVFYTVEKAIHMQRPGINATIKRQAASWCMYNRGGQTQALVRSPRGKGHVGEHSEQGRRATLEDAEKGQRRATRAGR